MKLRRHIQATKEKGAALLTVLVALMLLTLMVMELQYSSLIERKLAYNELNNLQAYYLAKSGAKIGLVRLSLFARVKRDKSIQTLAKNIDMNQYLDSIWNLPLPPFPMEASLVAKLGLQDKADAEKTIEETRVSEGQSSHTITSESSKINLNFLILPASERDKPVKFTSEPSNLVEYVGFMLVNLIEGFIKASDNPADEYGNLRPESLVLDIMDWINPGETSFAGGAKDSFYEAQNPPYKAKRAKFFTIEELRMVKGIDNHLYSKLRPNVTVSSYDGRININSASNTMIRALYPDFTEDDIKRIGEEKARIGAWPTEKAFVDFVGNTLGRAGFRTIYADEKNYPFTVNTQSFLIESLGTIKRSKSTIQKSIKVAVALMRAQGSSVDPSIKDKAACEKDPNMFFDSRGGATNCTQRPKSQQACETLAGVWVNEGGKQGCRFNLLGVIYPPEKATAEEPNALKILSWIES